MQRVELTDSKNFKLFCPFCGKVSIEPDGLEYCEHTLFHASEEGGFEYVSEKLNFEEDVEIDEDTSIDEFTDAIKYPNSIKFVIEQPAPSFFAGYVGFSDR